MTGVQTCALPIWVLVHTMKFTFSVDERHLVRTLSLLYILFFLDLLKIVLILICAIMLLEQKIPYIVVPQGLPLSGDITLVWHPNIVVSGSYTISEDVVTVSGWSKFVNRNAFLEIEDTVLLFLHIGTSRLFLFAFYIPTMPAEKDTDVLRQLLI